MSTKDGGTTAIQNSPFKSDTSEVLTWSLGGPDAEMVVHATGEQTGLACSMAEHTWAPGDQGGMHRHGNEDEGFYVLEGELTINMPEQGETFVVGAGEFVWQPRGGAHDYTVTSDGPARVLQILVPGTRLIPHFFKELSDGTAPLDDMAKLGQWVQDEYNVAFVVPE